MRTNLNRILMNWSKSLIYEDCYDQLSLVMGNVTCSLGGRRKRSLWVSLEMMNQETENPDFRWSKQWDGLVSHRAPSANVGHLLTGWFSFQHSRHLCFRFPLFCHPGTVGLGFPGDFKMATIITSSTAVCFQTFSLPVSVSLSLSLWKENNPQISYTL